MQLVINGKLVGYEVLNPKAKKTLLVLHGWGHSSLNWLPLANSLGSDTKIILLDLPGFGGSQFLEPGAGVPEYSDWVIKVTKKLELSRPQILGHSFGGQIAMYLAAYHPNQLSKLILVSPAGIRTKTKKQKIKILLYKKLKYLKFLLPKPLLRLIIGRFTSTDYLNASPEHKQVLKKIVTQDLTHLLHKIKTPTSLIWGELDKEIPYDGKRIANAIYDCRLYIVYGADHNPHLFKTSELSKLITKIVHD